MASSAAALTVNLDAYSDNVILYVVTSFENAGERVPGVTVSDDKLLFFDADLLITKNFDFIFNKIDF